MKLPHQSAYLLVAALAFGLTGAQGNGCMKRANVADATGDAASSNTDTLGANDSSSTDANSGDTTNHSGGDTSQVSADADGSVASDTAGADVDAGCPQRPVYEPDASSSDPYEPNDDPQKLFQQGCALPFVEHEGANVSPPDKGWERKTAYLDSGDVDWYTFTYDTSNTNPYHPDMALEASVLHRDTSASFDVELWKTTSSGSMQKVATAGKTTLSGLPLFASRGMGNDLAWYGLTHRPSSRHKQQYLLKVSGAQSRVRYTVLGFEKRPSEISGKDDYFCEVGKNAGNDSLEPNDMASAGTDLPELSQTSRFFTWGPRGDDTRLCSGDRDIYKLTVRPGESYEFKLRHYLTAVGELDVRKVSGGSLTNVSRMQSVRRGWSVVAFGAPSSGSSVDVIVSVDDRAGSPFVGRYALGYRRTQ